MRGSYSGKISFESSNINMHTRPKGSAQADVETVQGGKGAALAADDEEVGADQGRNL